MEHAPLPVLLSKVLVAYAIEFDDAFEQVMASTWARPFKVSIVMWSNFMRFVREDGTGVEDIVAASCTPKESVASTIGGMERWGYVTVDHDPAHGTAPRRPGFGSGRGVKAATLIRPSMTGALALKSWSTLPGEIEDRWRRRLSPRLIAELRDALRAITAGIDLVMPHFLPVVGPGGLFTRLNLEHGASEPDDDLPALLSRVLLAFTLEHEEGAEVSLPVGSNVLRVLSEQPTRVGDIPSRTGVSKEAVAMSMSWLASVGLISVEPDPTARGKVVRLTAGGRRAQDAHRRRLEETETRLQRRFGADAIRSLRSPLQEILGRPGGPDGPLSSGLVTPPGGWRATGRYEAATDAFVRSPRDALPEYPMVLHRGGWPDGS